jgi:hypothetical protein
MKKYHCSNPNCKSVFSEPKVIMYRVCPTCQTLIDSTAAIYQAGTVVEEEQLPTRQSKTTDVLKKQVMSQTEEPKTMETKNQLPLEAKEPEIAQPPVAEQETKETKSTDTATKPSPKTTESDVAELKPALSTKPEEPKPVQLEEIEPNRAEPKATMQQIEVESKKVEPEIAMPPKPIAQAKMSQQKIESKTMVQQSVKSKTDSPSSDKTCQHYYGYLGQREKGEGIPSSCVECAKSLDCMLAEYYKSKEIVEEIRKWYRPKL